MKKLIFVLLFVISIISYSYGDWRHFKTKDDFGEYTGRVLITTKVKNGNFDNMFTENGDLFGNFTVMKVNDNNYFRFLLRTYKDSNRPTKLLKINVEMRNNKDERIKFSSEKGTDIYFDRYNELTSFIKRSNGDIRVVVKDYGDDIYRFKFSSMGFTKTLNKLR